MKPKPLDLEDFEKIEEIFDLRFAKKDPLIKEWEKNVKQRI